jgi:hypothetical protein
MDFSHLLPVATPQHHTEFTSNPKYAVDLQDSTPQDGRLTEGSHPAEVGSSKNTKFSTTEGVDFRGRGRPQRNITDEQTVPTLNIRRSSRRKTLVLCFDGTGMYSSLLISLANNCQGNKFHGDTSDSNILKIFRMLDRSGEHNYHYYRKAPITF